MHKAINVVSRRRAIVIVAASGVRGALIYIELDSGHTPFNSIVRVVVVVVVRHTHRARTIAVARAREDAVRLPRALAAFASGGARVCDVSVFKTLYLFKTVGEHTVGEHTLELAAMDAWQSHAHSNKTKRIYR